MNTKNFSNLLIKVAGIIIVIVSVKNIPYYMPYLQASSLSQFLGTVVVPISLPVLIGVFMFIRPGRITDSILVEENQIIKNSDNETCMKLEQIALSVLGFYLLFQAMSDLHESPI